MNRIFENVGASTSHNSKDLHGLYRDNFILSYLVSIVHRIQEMLAYTMNRLRGGQSQSRRLTPGGGPRFTFPPQRLDRFWGPSNLLHNGCWRFISRE
jgi:hypothetical protein